MKSSKGKKSSKGYGKTFNVRDNEQSGRIEKIPSDGPSQDVKGMEMNPVGMRGNPAQAWNYKY